MRDHADRSEADALARRIDAVICEIEQFKRERAAADFRVARVRMAAAQTARPRDRRPNRAR